MSATKVPPPYKPKTTYKVIFGIPKDRSLQVYVDNAWKPVKIGDPNPMTLPNEFKIKYGPAGNLKPYTININKRSASGLAANIQYPFDFNGMKVANIGLPDG